MQRDEIYLVDMWRIFLREWRWFTCALVIVLAITFAFEHLAKRLARPHKVRIQRSSRWPGSWNASNWCPLKMMC
jgi:hypothetical protein